MLKNNDFLTKHDDSGRTWLNRSWEDCFLWVDRAGHWHVLAHTYTNDP